MLLALEIGKVGHHPATPPDLDRGVAPLGPPAPGQQPLLGGGVAPLDHRPDLGRGEAPLGRCSCAVAAWRSLSLPLTLDTCSSSGPRFCVVHRSRREKTIVS